MLELFDMLFDELAKRVKEAPGWVLLYFGIQRALSSIWIKPIAEQLHLGITESQIAEERSTIAALLAIALLSLGDVLDTVVFPREKDPNQGRKIMTSSILAFIAFACLWLAVKPGSEWALPSQGLRLFVLWLLFVLLLGRLPQLLGKSNPGETGWALFKTKTLATAQANARRELRIQRGIYVVSLALAKKAKRYKWGHPLWLENEFGKFFRSLVFPCSVVCVLLVRVQPVEAVVAGAGAVAFFCLYWSLKIRHMRTLYDTALDLVKDQGYKPVPSKMPNGKYAFFWNNDFVGSEP